MTFGGFKQTHNGGYLILVNGVWAGYDGNGEFDKLKVKDYLYQPLNGIYSMYLVK